MSKRTTPPFRADHVGSLLRPPELLRAREDFAHGRISADELRAIEDDAIRDVVRMQEEIGLQSATDGEFRRTSWHMDFIYQLEGIDPADEQIKVEFHNEQGDVEFTTAALSVHDRVGLQKTIFGDAFEALKSMTTTAMPKLTIPSPSMVHYRGGQAAISQDVYSDVDEFWRDLVAAYREEVRRLGALGCTYLQFDDTSLAYLNDPKQREYIASIGGDKEHQHEVYIRHINEALAERPEGMSVTTHMCRGNFRSSWAAEGGYDFVAEALFNELAGRRLLPRVRRRALRHLRAAPLRPEGKDGRARSGYDQAGRAGGQGRAEAAGGGGVALCPARAALPVAAVRILVDGRGQPGHP